ncbi:signal transduction histidine kinase [Hypnocyclicus thermotrophus]|uniref:histidine kinase n=1 Tax=Hypnocyclicus thermotrophus TaxID=1627895 RepID=A0AA46I5R4_9FUSO|nr:HAMP domain-containing sensor histidine kinase [Hypnocyclicus thermotrophus]TDT71399.1 signal transduction histidine kinase [Hypnocyclicus thermotrophus]
MNKELILPLIKKLDIGIVFFDEEYNISYINDAVRNIINKDISDEELENTIYLFIAYKNDFEKKVIRYNSKVLELSKKKIFDMEEMIGAVLLIKDVSLEKLTEEVEKQKLEQDKEQLAKYIAHEVRNSLNLISGFTELIQESEDILDIKENIKVIFDETKRMEKMVSDILDYTKREPLTLSRKNIVDIIKNLIHYKNIEHIVKLVDKNNNPIEKEIYVMVNEDKIKQVFLNLIDNGLSAIEGLEEKIFFIKFKEKENSIELHFITNYDKNSFISLSELFKPYYTTKNKGTGLGLVICKKIIEEHNGTIEVYKNEFHGLTFVIDLKK